MAELLGNDVTEAEALASFNGTRIVEPPRYGTITSVISAKHSDKWGNTWNKIMVFVRWDGEERIHDYSDRWREFQLVPGLDEVFLWLNANP
jgi:hypothetical protein